MRKLNLKIVSISILIFFASFFIFPSIIFSDSEEEEDEEEDYEEEEEEDEEDKEDDDDVSFIFEAQNTSNTNNTSTAINYVYDTGGMIKYVYSQILNREPSQAEINSWLINLNNGNASTYTLIKAALFGIETGSQINALSNEDYVYFLYKLLFQRNPNLDGLNAWYNRLQSGKSKNEVLQGFIVSQEYANFCSKFGVKPYLSKEINNKIILSLYKIGSSPSTFTYIVEMIQQEPTSSSNSGSSQATNTSTSSPSSSTPSPPHSDRGSCSKCH